MCFYRDHGICVEDCYIVQNEGDLQSCKAGKEFREQERALEAGLKTPYLSFNFLAYYRRKCRECSQYTKIGVCEKYQDGDIKSAMLACHCDELLETGDKLLEQIKDSITEFRLLCVVKGEKK